MHTNVVMLKKGSTFTLTTDLSVLGDETTVAVQYPNLPKVLVKGSKDPDIIFLFPRGISLRGV